MEDYSLIIAERFVGLHEIVRQAVTVLVRGVALVEGLQYFFFFLSKSRGNYLSGLPKREDSWSDDQGCISRNLGRIPNSEGFINRWATLLNKGN